MTTPIAVRGLVKYYERRPVLDGVDLAIPSGSVCGLLGRNGAGKTTLLRALVGLIRVDGGESRILGAPSWDPPDAVKARLGYVAQVPELPQRLTVAACLDLVAAFQPQWDMAWARSLAERFELPLHTQAKSLSVGQQQLLALVMALGHRPQLLILDEPAAALDPVVRRRFLGALAELAGTGATVLFSTHLTADLDRIADAVAVLHRGRIAAHLNVAELAESGRRHRCAQLPAGCDPRAWPGVVGVMTLADGVVVHATDPSVESRLRAAGVDLVGSDALGLDDLLIGVEAA
jgi:ABC-2 type transport system ATP-binding protein